MLAGMAISSDRMRFKDKIIANIAKAIKGIQEAVYFKSQNIADDGPLILRNSDRQCHKLCENLDHVFLHGLRQHSHGYWKVVTEYTHKNAVQEIKNLRNVTTDLGRGRAWIFMALNDSLLESYIRCVTDHTKVLKKHYAKDALLLDQQQMSLLLTLTSGLECVVFQLEYDLPYLDLTAYPPRTRTASEIEEDEEEESSVVSGRNIASRPSTETAASTPESSKGMTDSDTASLSSLDTSAVRSGSARISSISMDSGFPGDAISIHSTKQRSVTPIDTLSISSLGSVGEPDRLMRLENIISHTDEVEEVDGGGFEVIRVKGGKKSSSGKKKSSKKNGKRVVSPVSQVSSATFVDISSQAIQGEEKFSQDASEPKKIPNSTAARSCEENNGSPSLDAGSPIRRSPFSDQSLSYGKSPPGVKSPPDRESPAEASSGSLVGGGLQGATDAVNTFDTMGRSVSNSMESNVERLAAETKNSLVNRFAELDTTVAGIRATTTSLHQHQEQQQTNDVDTDARHSPVQTLSPLQNPDPDHSNTSPHSCIPSKDSAAGHHSETVSGGSEVTESIPVVSEQDSEVLEDEVEPEKQLSALEEMESKCAQLCRPMSDVDNRSKDIVDSTQHTKEEVQVSNALESMQHNQRAETAISVGNNDADEGFGNQLNEEEEEEVDFYNAPSKVGTMTTRTQSYNQLQDYVDYISGRHDEQIDAEGQITEEEENSQPQHQQREWTKDYALRLDNNTKLQIMLDIFTRDDEEFVKMFVSREGHSEGDTKVTFVLVSNHTLYLLKQRETDRKFETEVAIPLKDLSFISLSLNKQIVNIESSGPNRRKERIWLTPGDHLLAQQILDCLEGAMKNIQQPTSLRSRFSIGSDEPLQIIALRKYIARDSHCEEQDVEIEDYSLVFWEDPQSKAKQTSTSREGTMLLRSNDPFKGHVWKPVYVVLRDFMLCIFASKADSKPQQYIRLGGEQCVGCRLAASQERPHCLEIILAKGGSWFLSVATEEEVASWRHSLCLAVSEGVQDSTNLSCLPCVSVVTGQKLLLCHEDVQTKFCRTIASAKVEEVTALTIDPEADTYCVVEFESQEVGVSSERWVLYFNSPLEMERFVQALSKVWNEVYQVSLSAQSIEDLPLQKHCQDQVFLLQRAVSMK